jgi:histidinol-phosphatase (PHP family)
VIGFSEHSPRPQGYDYPTEYRETLRRGFPLYVDEVRALQGGTSLEVLLGMEMDWLGAEQDFVRQAVAAWPFDYLLGSVHFLGHWGFDATAKDWEPLDTPTRYAHYAAYFVAIKAMASSGLFHIAAHLDLIKIFSVQSFQAWLDSDTHNAKDAVRDALVAIRDAGMGMEISSAGLRKPCAEIYPGPVIMALAVDLGVPITFASDAHATDQVALYFDQLAAYAASFGYTHSVVFRGGACRKVPFV